MTTECGFCKGTKVEPGFTECVWCDNTGIDRGLQPDDLKKAIAKSFTKGDTDPVGDCDKFEAGIHVGAWFQRIVVYGDSPADAEALRDKLMELAADRDAALARETDLLRDVELWRSRCGAKCYEVDALQQRVKMLEVVALAAKAIGDEITGAEEERGRKFEETYKHPANGKQEDNAVTVTMRLLNSLRTSLKQAEDKPNE